MARPHDTPRIFFVHRGPLQPYVRAAILQACAADTQSTVVLLGDQPIETVAAEILLNVDYALLKNHSDSAEEFGRHYRFEGSNPLEYTRGNFQRWFYVDSFCKENSLTGPFLVLDSDSYLYMPVREVAPHLSTEMTVVDRVGPQFTFFLGIQALHDFTSFLLESFARDKGFQRLRDFVRERSNDGVPHVSDMAAFGVYARDKFLEDLGASDRQNFVFCENLGSPQGLVMNLLGKKVTTRRRRKYFTTLQGKKVIAGGVHLQGGNKALWPYFVDATVKRTFREYAPQDYSVARRTALKKAFQIVLLKSAGQARRLFAVPPAGHEESEGNP